MASIQSSTTINTTMQNSFVISGSRLAWRITGQGAPKDVLALHRIPMPERLEKDHVLVKVYAAALNPVGHKLMRLLPSFVTNRPSIAEYDFAGEIFDGNGTMWRKGNQVFGWNTMWSGTTEGALTEFVVVRADHIWKKPENLNFVEASGIALVGLTAYQALYKVAQLKPKQRIFVNGGSTAVGGYAIQMARVIGAYVVATASARSKKYVLGLGANEVVDYTTQNVPEYLTKNYQFDVFLEAVGLCDPTLYNKSEGFLTPNGVFISVLPTLSDWRSAVDMVRLAISLGQPSFLGGVNRRWIAVVVKNDQTDLTKVEALLSKGHIKPSVDSVYDFKNALAAYDRIMSERAQGKVVVRVGE